MKGSSLAELATRRHKPAAEAMLDLLLEHEAAVSIVMFSQAEANVQKALRQPYVMIGSDSLGLASGHGPHAGRPHPRMYGTFPRVLGKYVREAKLFSHEEAVAKMTGTAGREARSAPARARPSGLLRRSHPVRPGDRARRSDLRGPAPLPERNPVRDRERQRGGRRRAVQSHSAGRILGRASRMH